ncbi:hypothetical protein CGJ21_24275 [Vibrio parahaemolyticus]|nr:hypothetical protein CGJ23_24350 [Vibrio parahaemolyticus]TOF44293.1 hypothetical protein CGJ21_24275 [Vibrio parahaemolyticus]
MRDLGFLFQKLISLLKACSAALSFQKVCLVFKFRFLRRCKFQVVSVTSCFETKPDLSASKHIMLVVCKV